ncbi:glycosyltransferase family 4 protein [Bacteroidota bacterium]
MRILMFGWEFPPHITGGLGTACFGLTKALASIGVQIKFIVPKAFGDEDTSLVKLVDAENIEINQRHFDYEEFWNKLTYLEIGSNLIPYVSPELFKNLIEQNNLDKTNLKESVFSSSFKFSGKYGKDLMDEVTRYALIAGALGSMNDFDIIHAHDWLTYPAGIVAKQVSGKPLIIHVHATEFDRSGENINQNVYDIEKKGMETADRIITVSNFTKNIVVNRYGIDPDKITTVYNGVDFYNNDNGNKKPNTLYNDKIVTFLGRVTFQKGPDYFVEAANKVLQKYQNVRFVMAGSGDMLTRMIKRVAQLGISNKFHFTGFLKGIEVDEMFRYSDVYVMPSVSEPFGISPLEAMRSNVPVIISKQSGVAEILNHAIKIDFWDIDAMADAMYGLLNYEALSRFFVKYGKGEVDNLKWDNAAHQVNKIYQEII